MRLLPFLALTSALTGAHLAGSPTAEACSPLPTPAPVSSFWLNTSLVDDGLIFISAQCPGGCAPLSQITLAVRDSEGVLVEGSIFELSAAEFVWRSNEPFQPGTYTFEASHPDYDPIPATPFEVTGKVSSPPPGHSVMASSHARLEGPSACCAAGITDSCGRSACYTLPEGVSRTVSLNLDFEAEELPEQRPFAYRARALGDEWPDGFFDYQIIDFTLDEQASEYCYQIQTQDLRTGGALTEETYCFPATQVPAPNELDFEGIERNLFAECTVPPEGYEEQWCKTFAEAIQTGTCGDSFPGSPCNAALAACSPPSDGSVSTGGAPGETVGSGGAIASTGGRVAATGGSATSGDGSTSEGDDAARDAGGTNVRACSYGGAPRSSSTGWLLLGASALAVMSRRRSAARSP